MKNKKVGKQKDTHKSYMIKQVDRYLHTHKSYMIKQVDRYLHMEGDNLIFKTKKEGCLVYGADEAQIVIEMLEQEGAIHVFKSPIKAKNVYERPKELMENWRRKRIAKQHEKRVAKIKKQLED